MAVVSCGDVHSPSRAVPNPNIYSTIRISTQKCMKRLSPYISIGVPQPPRGSGMRKCSAGARAAVLPRKKVFGFRICSSSESLNFVYVRFSIRSPAFLASALFLDVCKANSQLHTRLLRTQCPRPIPQKFPKSAFHSYVNFRLQSADYSVRWIGRRDGDE